MKNMTTEMIKLMGWEKKNNPQEKKKD